MGFGVRRSAFGVASCAPEAAVKLNVVFPPCEPLPLWPPCDGGEILNLLICVNPCNLWIRKDGVALPKNIRSFSASDFLQTAVRLRLLWMFARTHLDLPFDRIALRGAMCQSAVESPLGPCTWYLTQVAQAQPIETEYPNIEHSALQND